MIDSAETPPCMYVVTELFPDRGEEAVLVNENECYVNQGITTSEPSELSEPLQNWLEDSKNIAQGIIDDIEHYFNDAIIDDIEHYFNDAYFNMDEFSVPLREWREEDEIALEEELAQEEKEEEEKMDLREN